MRWQHNSNNQVSILNLIWKQQQKYIYIPGASPRGHYRADVLPPGVQQGQREYFHLSDTYINCLVWSDVPQVHIF